MKISAAVIALSKIAPLAQAKQPSLSATSGRNKTSAPARLWISYRLSRRAWLASRCFVRLRILWCVSTSALLQLRWPAILPLRAARMCRDVAGSSSDPIGAVFGVSSALRILKKKMQREGMFKEMRRARFYEKPSIRAAREKADAIRRAHKLARRQAFERV